MNHTATRLARSRWIIELRRTGRLALPIIGGMLGHMLLGIADTIMVGRVGVVPLAACSLVNGITHVPMVMSFGLLVSVAVGTAQAYGAKNRPDAAATLKHGMVLALVAGLGTALSQWWLAGYLTAFGQAPEVVAIAGSYMVLVAWSILPLMIYHAIKQFGEALNVPEPAMWITWFGVLLNIFLNWILIYGNLGSPALGLDGAGIATLIARAAMALVALVWLFGSRRLQPWRPASWRNGWSFQHLRRLLRLGIPAATQQGAEVAAFVGGGIMMGWMGAVALAAHQIAITIASTTFVVALSVAMAVGVRVGHAWGAGLPRRLRLVAGGGLLLGAGFMTACALAFFLAGETLAGWFVDAQEVIQLTAALLIIAGFFQIADGTQVVMMFATRGMSDVKVPTAIALIAYWLIALPVGYVSAFILDWGPRGIWFGLAFGLTSAAVLLSWRFLIRSRQVNTDN